MSERGMNLMKKANRQVDEIAGLLRTLDEADLAKPARDDGGDCTGDTVGALAAHVAEGYHRLGGFLEATGYLHGSPAAGDGHGGACGHSPAPKSLADVLDRLTSGRDEIAKVAKLTDDQLDSVPDQLGRFSDGRRTLEGVIDAVIAHQAEHAATLKRAVA